MDSKFEQISSLFSQFSEENKDKLLESAKILLKVQLKGLTHALDLKDDVTEKRSVALNKKSHTG